MRLGLTLYGPSHPSPSVFNRPCFKGLVLRRECRQTILRDMTKTTASNNRRDTAYTLVDRKRAEQLALDLMAIPGVSGEEHLVADFIQTELRTAGAPSSAIKMDRAHTKTPIDGTTGNLCLKLSGKRRAPRRLLMAHMDTVPICAGCQPKRKGGFVRSADPTTGLGADDRAGVAVTLFTALELIRRQVDHPPLTFLWTIQEEIGLHGARHVRTSMLGKPQLSFNWDGGSPFKMTVGATGGYRLQIDIHGLASHAGNAPERGVSAIAIAGIAIADLHKNGWHGLVRKGTKTGSTNIGVIQGGMATNVVTDRVTLKAEARSHCPTFRRRIVREIEKACRRAVDSVRSAQRKKGKLTIDGRLDYESFRIPDNSSAVVAARKAITDEGLTPLASVTNGGLDANWMFQHGIPTVTLGCGQLNAHMVTEALDLDAFWDACRIARRLATGNETGPA